MTIEVDLLDQDGVIVSIAAADPNFWAYYSGYATTYAAQRGFDIYVPGGAPQPGTVERGLTAWGDFTNWVANNAAGARAPAPVPSSSSTPIVIGLAAVAALALGALFVATRPPS